MKTAQQLLDEWTDGDSTGMRPQRIQRLREDLMDATGEYIPRRIPEIEAVILNSQQQKGVITRRLREATEGSDEPVERNGDEPPDDGDDE